jgi:adenine-specific DNA-methyltransferase
VNLYTAFVALALQQLEPGGQLVAITPRSFCNGTYYEPFRRFLLDLSALVAIHVFESRKSTFRDDDVLQENVIFHLQRAVPQNGVALSTDLMPAREVHFSEVVRPGDPHAFIRLPVGGASARRCHPVASQHTVRPWGQRLHRARRGLPGEGTPAARPRA